MADFGLFLGFGTPVRGQERQAIAVFNEGMEYWTRLQQQGEIGASRASFSTHTAGISAGFTLLRGDRDKLESIRTNDEFARQSIRAGLITERLGVVGAVLGERLGTLMGVYNEQLEELTSTLGCGGSLSREHGGCRQDAGHCLAIRRSLHPCRT